MTNEVLSLDAVGPMPVHWPATVAGAAAIVKEHAAVFPVGGRTALTVGMPPSKTGIALDTRSLDRLIDYPHDDMTVTVEAGMTVATLTRHLAEKGQALPVDLALADQATIGGAVAVNAAGPRRLLNGTLRDWLIGISFIADNGDVVSGGGRVVKNVAGYDLMKLHLGARGQFGIITQLTFKVKPRPVSTAFVSWGIRHDQLASTLDSLHTSAACPVGVDLLNRPAAKTLGLPADSAWTVVCLFEEKRVTLDWQIETLQKDLYCQPIIDRDDDASKRLTALTDFPCTTGRAWSWRFAVRPSEVAAILPQDCDDLIHAHGLTGQIWRHTSHDHRPYPSATAWTCPSERKTPEIILGPNQSDSALRQRIKATLDPAQRFNPGRV